MDYVLFWFIWLRLLESGLQVLGGVCVLSEGSLVVGLGLRLLSYLVA